MHDPFHSIPFHSVMVVLVSLNLFYNPPLRCNLNLKNDAVGHNLCMIYLLIINFHAYL